MYKLRRAKTDYERETALGGNEAKLHLKISVAEVQLRDKIQLFA